jgi:hypothetical protein
MMGVILALRRPRQKNLKFQASVGYRVIPVLKTKTETTRKVDRIRDKNMKCALKTVLWKGLLEGFTFIWGNPMKYKQL